MLNIKKAIYCYLSCYDLASSWEDCPEIIKRTTLGLEAMSDYSEISLGTATQYIEKFERKQMTTEGMVTGLG